MEQLLQIVVYLCAGFVEMFLITQRTLFISRNRRKWAAVIVFLENTITFFVILQLAKNVTGNLPSFGAYCIGSCTGTIFDIEKWTNG